MGESESPAPIFGGNNTLSALCGKAQNLAADLEQTLRHMDSHTGSEAASKAILNSGSNSQLDSQLQSTQPAKIQSEVESELQSELHTKLQALFRSESLFETSSEAQLKATPDARSEVATDTGLAVKNSIKEESLIEEERGGEEKGDVRGKEDKEDKEDKENKEDREKDGGEGKVEDLKESGGSESPTDSSDSSSDDSDCDETEENTPWWLWQGEGVETEESDSDDSIDSEMDIESILSISDAQLADMSASQIPAASVSQSSVLGDFVFPLAGEGARDVRPGALRKVPLRALRPCKAVHQQVAAPQSSPSRHSLFSSPPPSFTNAFIDCFTGFASLHAKSLSASPSVSLTHTHTHTHTLPSSLSPSPSAPSPAPAPAPAAAIPSLAADAKRGVKRRLGHVDCSGPLSAMRELTADAPRRRQALDRLGIPTPSDLIELSESGDFGVSGGAAVQSENGPCKQDGPRLQGEAATVFAESVADSGSQEMTTEGALRSILKSGRKSPQERRAKDLRVKFSAGVQVRPYFKCTTNQYRRLSFA